MELHEYHALDGQYLHVRISVHGPADRAEVEMVIDDLSAGTPVPVCERRFGPAPRSEVLTLVDEALDRLGLTLFVNLRILYAGCGTRV